MPYLSERPHLVATGARSVQVCAHYQRAVTQHAEPRICGWLKPIGHRKMCFEPIARRPFTVDLEEARIVWQADNRAAVQRDDRLRHGPGRSAKAQGKRTRPSRD